MVPRGISAPNICSWLYHSLNSLYLLATGYWLLADLNKLLYPGLEMLERDLKSTSTVPNQASSLHIQWRLLPTPPGFIHLDQLILFHLCNLISFFKNNYLNI